ncbi:MAG: protein kinase, partial [Pirellulales bacterium]|nr:protein kinase [Pirellulales bacterium]
MSGHDEPAGNDSGASSGSQKDSNLEAPTEVSRGPEVTRADSGRNENNASGGAASSLIGCRLGDYQVLRKLGRGGMADVYVARQLSLGRDVALKVLKNEFARDQDYVARFRREARAAAKLNHPNIVQVYDVGSADSMHYIAQELVDGENLREVL